MKAITEYKTCQCGAISLYFEDNESSHCKLKNIGLLGISLIGVTKLQGEYYACDHCVNGYGLDVCECGSGKTVDECCKRGVRETFGESPRFGGMWS